MLANDLILDKKDGSDVTFRLFSTSTDGSRRSDIASTLALPTILTIKHSQQGKSPNVVDRHLVQLSKTLATAAGTTQVICNFTVTVPRDVAVSTANVHDVISHVVDFLTDLTSTGLATTANIDAILRGES